MDEMTISEAYQQAQKERERLTRRLENVQDRLNMVNAFISYTEKTEKAEAPAAATTEASSESTGE